MTAADARASARGFVFDPGAADHAVSFFRAFLRHSKGQWFGQPFDLLPWQATAIGQLFGWRAPDGSRRFRRAYLSTAKKNGKSELAAGIALYCLVADGEPAPEVYIAARDRWQASIIYDVCARMVRQAPALREVLEVVESRRVIAAPGLVGKLEALSADAPKTEGISASAVLFDELHVQHSRVLFDALAYSGAARRQPLIVMLTTAGVFDPGAIAWEQYQYARGVANGTIEDDRFFACVYEADPAADWTDPATWAAGNPSLGVTITAEDVAQACREAAASPGRQNAFRRYRLNQWVQSVERAVDLRVWDASAGHTWGAAGPPDAGGLVWGGLDLASTRDLTALVWCRICPADPEAVDVWGRVWAPEVALRDGANAALYAQWAAAGWLEVTPGNSVDYGRIVARVLEDGARWRIESLGVDRLFQGMAAVQALQAEGIAAYGVGQGYQAMAPVIQLFEGLLLPGRLHHGGAPILRWSADNLVITADAMGRRRPDRKRSTAKIDPIVALLMALDAYSRRGDTGTAYADRGVEVVGDGGPGAGAWGVGDGLELED